MQQICANAWCKQTFEITDEDLAFYDKVSPVFGDKKEQIPPPTLCPQCRQQRRYAIRNERNLYKRTCDLCKKSILSMYSPDKPFPVYCPECWWSDKWHGTTHGREVDLTRPFFEQIEELQCTVPRISLYLVNSQNCDYCNFLGDCKNCYLTFGSVYSEDCLYGSAYYAKNCVDNLVTRECQWSYECTDCRQLYSCFYCQDCYHSDHLFFCYDLQGCSECIACAGLRNAKYHIGNKQYDKKEYEAVKRDLNFCNPTQKKEWLTKLQKVKQTTIRHYMPSSNVQNVSGTHIYNSKNTFRSFFVDRCEDCAYCMQVVDLKDCYDNNYTEENELCNEYLGMYGATNAFFSTFSRSTYEVYYSEYCIGAKYMFGCTNVRDREYCILNKQYTKEEYEELVPKIIEHMRSTGEWGEFFPVALSPFAYNETVAQEYFPLSEEEVLKRGWKWRDQKDEIPKVERIIPAAKLPNSINDIPDDILNWAVECEATKRPFRIIKQELDFYRKMRLPIPHFHPDERHKHRMALRNPRKLFSRTCAKCEKPIQTTYAPDRPEIVYCEECYLKEVY
ncbi:hypothetical protein COU80_02725 [Candidatus Peregrinibacteria bacterium CG10_big_fil_rev_8_21_14_0_10_55_24]|nr:MAG: hypothetical protein COU80_02725 [Candidatus Peregrinibacteria bacterium CG10_big_fil_rev_8_21_14_0_10_55_24]